ncbi:MAG: hypothetical protein IKB86_00915 [Clostridia bacterium]|nr:hypothetical protein [Clostridia bacterium]
MKNFKKLIGVMLIAVIAFAMVACDGNGKGGNPTPLPTIKPTPVSLAAKITEEQLNNYYVTYEITTKVTEQDKNGVWGEHDDVLKCVEAGLDGATVKSTDNAVSFKYDDNGNSSFLITETTNRNSFFSAHNRYKLDELENKGTETVAGFETTHYYYENGLYKVHMWVANDFDLTLKFEDWGYAKFSAEVKELTFGEVTEEDFLDYAARVATPVPKK